MSSHYASLLSLKHNLERIKYFIEVSVLPWFPLIDSLYEYVLSLGDFLENNICGKDWNHLYEELREVICKMEDVVESQMSAHLLSGSEKTPIDICKVEQEIDLFRERVDKIKECLSRNFPLHVPPPPPPPLSRRWFTAKGLRRFSCSCFSRNSALEQVVPSFPKRWVPTKDVSELVGMRHEQMELKGRLHHMLLRQMELKGQLLSYEGRRIKITGMAGIGKTAIAKAVCEDPQVWNHFKYHIFVPVGPNRQWKEILLCILSQLDCGGDDDNDALEKRIPKTLKGKTCLFLFDDVWDQDVWTSSNLFLENNRSCLIITSRLRDYFCDHKMRFLDEEESWELLRRKVFATDSCPYELKKLGKKIAEKCEGLPLAIISVANHLVKAEKTVEYWESVADKGIASIICADDEVFKVLHPSYRHLPLQLKLYFLYLGVYPQCCEISTAKIVKLWIAEGFLETKTSKEYAQMCLKKIDRHSIIIIKQRRELLGTGTIVKSCSLHIVYWCYNKIQAQNEKFFQILSTVDDLEGAESQRKLCIHNNSLFGIKDFHKSIASVSKYLRSLLCTGPYHKYPISISSGLKLVRVLDAVAIRFFVFPLEVLNLVLLRYLAITYDGNLPGFISRLISLEFLIVRRHVRIIDPRCPSYLPDEVWKMKELRHLQVVGSDLPEPALPGDELPNLVTLLDVTPRSCTLSVLEKIPNLRKLGVQIVLPAADAIEEPLNHLSKLNGLKSLSCVIVNPKPSSPIAANTYPTSIFPKRLEKLALSGFGYSWDQMSTIASLEKLKVLKLRHCAFQGSTWEVKKDEFRNLEFLLLEDIDLRYCRADRNSFGKLRHLIIRHCYNLENVTTFNYHLRAFEVVDCKPCVVDYVKNYAWGFTRTIVSSWEDGKVVK